MLIKVRDSKWFDPAGIHLEQGADTTVYSDNGKHEVFTTLICRMPGFRSEGRHSMSNDEAIICRVIGHPDEVAAEINKQIKGIRDAD